MLRYTIEVKKRTGGYIIIFLEFGKVSCAKMFGDNFSFLSRYPFFCSEHIECHIFGIVDGDSTVHKGTIPVGFWWWWCDCSYQCELVSDICN